jgi:hypothetical protein
MDFKVAGTRAGLTAVQLDMKVPGLRPQLLAEALQPARAAREQLMEAMEAAVAQYAPPAGDVAVFGSAEINKELLVGGSGAGWRLGPACLLVLLWLGMPAASQLLTRHAVWLRPPGMLS